METGGEDPGAGGGDQETGGGERKGKSKTDQHQRALPLTRSPPSRSSVSPLSPLPSPFVFLHSSFWSFFPSSCLLTVKRCLQSHWTTG